MARQLAKTRDVTPWQATMGRLDAEERVAKEPVACQTAPEIVDYTRSLPASGPTPGQMAARRS